MHVECEIDDHKSCLCWHTPHYYTKEDKHLGHKDLVDSENAKEDEDSKSCEFSLDEEEIIKEQLAVRRQKDEECLQFLVFSDEAAWYILFNSLISVLCLLSSYIYMHEATFRNL